MKRLATLLFAALFPAIASAQAVQMNGVIEPAGAPTICPGYQYVVAGTSVLLDTSLFDVAPFVGDLVQIQGTDVTGACPAPIVRVTSVGLPTATLEACGTLGPGCTVRFRVGPPTISIQALAVSPGAPGFANLGAPIGVLTLGSPLIVLGSTGAAGVFDVRVPSSIAPGTPIWAQGYHQDVGPITGPGSLSNQLALLATGGFCVDPSSCGF